MSIDEKFNILLIIVLIYDEFLMKKKSFEFMLRCFNSVEPLIWPCIGDGLC